MAKIGELVINFKANTSAFSTDIKKMSDLSFSSSKNIEKSFKVIGTAALAAFSGVVAAGVVLAEQWAEAGTAVFEASEKTGLAVQNLSGLRATAKLLDEDFGALVTTLARMEKNITAGLNEPSEKAGKTLKGLFKSTDELNRLGLLPMDARVAEVTKRIFGLNDVGQRNLALTNLAGRGWMESLSTLQELASQGYDPLIARAKALGQFFDEENARKARAFRIELEQMEATASGLGLAIGKTLAPALSQLVVLTEIKLQQGLGKNLRQSLRDAAAGFVDLSFFIGTAGHGFGLFTKEADNVTRILAGGAKETQAMTDSLVALDAMVRALAKGTGDSGDNQDKTGKDTKAAARAKELAAATGHYGEILTKLRDVLAGTTPALEHYRDTMRGLSELQVKGVNVIQGQVAAGFVFITDRNKELAEATEKTNEALAKQVPLWEQDALGLARYNDAVAAALAQPPPKWDTAERAKEIADIFKDLNREISEVGKSRDEIIIQRLNELHAGSEKIALATEKLKEMRLAAHDLGLQMREAFEHFKDSAAGAFASAIVGATSFSEAMRRLAQDIAYTITKLLIMKMIEMGVNALFGAEKGAEIKGFAKGGEIKGFAGGGVSPVGQPIWVGERGPEIFVPDRAGSIIPNFQIDSLPARAAGGSAAEGVPHLVGERGPEIFVPDVAGSIVPTQNIGGTSIVNNYSIDARGADAGVERRLLRALRAVHRSAVSTAQMAMQDRMLRSGA